MVENRKYPQAKLSTTNCCIFSAASLQIQIYFNILSNLKKKLLFFKLKKIRFRFVF